MIEKDIQKYINERCKQYDDKEKFNLTLAAINYYYNESSKDVDVTMKWIERNCQSNDVFDISNNSRRYNVYPLIIFGMSIAILLYSFKIDGYLKYILWLIGFTAFISVVIYWIVKKFSKKSIIIEDPEIKSFNEKYDYTYLAISLLTGLWAVSWIMLVFRDDARNWWFTRKQNNDSSSI